MPFQSSIQLHDKRYIYLATLIFGLLSLLLLFSCHASQNHVSLVIFLASDKAVGFLVSEIMDNLALEGVVDINDDLLFRRVLHPFGEFAHEGIVEWLFFVIHNDHLSVLELVQVAQSFSQHVFLIQVKERDALLDPHIKVKATRIQELNR